MNEALGEELAAPIRSDPAQEVIIFPTKKVSTMEYLQLDIILDRLLSLKMYQPYCKQYDKMFGAFNGTVKFTN